MSDDTPEARLLAGIRERMREKAAWHPERERRERHASNPSDRTEHDAIGRAILERAEWMRVSGAPVFLYSQQTERSSYRGPNQAARKRAHGRPGQADYVGAAYGFPLGIEVKSRTSQLSTTEREWRGIWVAAGAIYEIVRCVDDFTACVERLKRERARIDGILKAHNVKAASVVCGGEPCPEPDCGGSFKARRCGGAT